MVEYEWDDNKADANLSKHGVSFEEAKEALEDPNAITYDDPLHSDEEDRFLTIGQTGANRLILVSHTDREDQTRIISARIAKPSEQRKYANAP